MSSMASTGYKTACSRIAGRSHLATSTPCQDFVAATRSLQGLGCIALADGAGSRAHSETGAQIAVKTTLRVLRRDFDALFELAGTDPSQVAAKLLAACRQALRRKAKTMGVAPQALGCTLMFAACRDGRYLAGHLGDGIIAIETAPGGVEVLSHPDNGEFANTTVFVTEPDALDRFRIYAGTASAPSFVVMSDGTAETLYQRATRRPASALQKLLQWTRDLPQKKVEEILFTNLEQVFGKKSADDCSIGLLAALPQAPAVPANAA